MLHARRMASVSDSDGRRESITFCTISSTTAGLLKVVMLQCVSTCCSRDWPMRWRTCRSRVIGQRGMGNFAVGNLGAAAVSCRDGNLQLLGAQKSSSVCHVLMQYLAELSPCVLRLISDVSWRLRNSSGRRRRGRSGSRDVVHSSCTSVMHIPYNVCMSAQHSAASSVRLVRGYPECVHNETPACCRLVARPGTQIASLCAC